MAITPITAQRFTMFYNNALFHPTLAELHTIAQDAGLSFAFGRACYLKNRMHNTGHRGIFSHYYTTRHDFTLACIAFMRSARPSTARRWAAHIRAGGHLKGLRHKNRAKFLAQLRKQKRANAKLRASMTAYNSVGNAYVAQALASGMPEAQAYLLRGRAMACRYR
jgi:hypothetical protein